MALYTFDLVERPWLPVRTGTAVEMVGLREMFLRAHEITDIEVGLPPAASGLWRILTLIAARIARLGPHQDVFDFYDARNEVLARGTFADLPAGANEHANAVEEYFARFADRFDVFHPERPFLQDRRLAEECAKSTGLDKLVMSRPAGNNQIWFDHHHSTVLDPISTSEAVLHLVAQLYYGPSGRCTSRTVGGTADANTTAGPLRGVISFHPVGANLFESLVMGIPYVGRVSEADDLAPWEREEISDPRGVPPRPEGVGGVLAGRFRHAVLLAPGSAGETVVDAHITWAWRQAHAAAKEPYLVLQNNKKGEPYARPASADRALWRDLDSLLNEDQGIEHRRRPPILDHAEFLPIELLARIRVRAFGFDQDGQTRNRQWFTTMTPPVLGMLREPDTHGGVSRVREAAENVEWHLRAALRIAWVAVNDPSNGVGKPARKDIPEGPWPRAAALRFWPQAERRFWRRIQDRDFEAPTREFISLALQVFDEVTDQASRPRVRGAVEHARGYIFRADKTSKGGAA